MKIQSQNSCGFQGRTTRQLVATGEIPKWVIDRLVSVGYEDPRKEYRLMTIVNAVCLLIVLCCTALVAFVLNTARNTMGNVGIADLIAPMVVIIFYSAIAAGCFLMRGLLEDRMLEKTKRFDQVIERLIRSPRPQFTPADLVTKRELYVSVENALVNLAACKTVFLEHERKVPGSARILSNFANEDLGKLLDVGKELGVVDPNYTYVRFFQRAEICCVDKVREKFVKMLAGLKPNEQPPLFWYPDSN
ncbi:MAG: hypothetical protein AAB391_03205 [Patescibacteria group bacterium]